MAQQNIINTKTGQGGYQVPGAPIPTGWMSSSNPSATSPAREAYTSSLANNPPGGFQSADVTKTMKDIYTPINGGSTSASPTDYLKSYRDYLSKYSGSLTEDPNVTTATNELTNIQNLQDAKTLASRKQYEDIIHQSGMLKGGAQEAGALSDRNTSYELANLGVAESGAARKLAALTGTQTAKQNYYKTLLDASKPVQVGDQYIDPTTGEIIKQTPKEKTGIAGEYEYAKTQGYTGTFTQYQNEDANRKMSTTAAPKPTTQEVKDNAYTVLNQFMTPGKRVGNVPVLDPEGYLTAEAFKQLVSAAKEEGISRKEFIAEYASYIGNVNSNFAGYGLTPAEIKLLGGI